MNKWLYKKYDALLTWLQRVIGIDTRYYIHNGIWLSLGQLATTLVTFIASIAFANWLTPDEYGLYKYVLSIFQVIAIFALSEIGTAIVQGFQRHKALAIRQLSLQQLKWALIGSVAGYLIAVYHYFHRSPSEGIGIAIASFALPFYAVASLYDPLLRGRKQFKTSSLYAVAVQAAISVCSVILLLLHVSWLFVLAGYFIVSVVARIYPYYREVTELRETAKTSALELAKTTHEVVDYAKHLTLMKGAGQLANTLSQWLLFHVAGAGALSSFFIAIAPAEQVRGWIAIVGQLMLPKTAESDGWRHLGFKGWWRKSLPFIFMVVLFSIAYTILAPLLFTYVFPQYVAIRELSQVYIWTLPITAVSILFSSVLKGVRSLQALHAINVLNIVTAIGVMVPLTYIFGIYGLISGVFIGKILEVSWMAYEISRLHRA